MDIVRGIGLVDELLIEREEKFIQQFDGLRGVIDTPTDLELRTLCHLWVLGAYEVVRMLAKWPRRDPTISFASYSERLTKLKGKFERLRIPLGKQEVAERFKKTDSPFAFPTVVAGHGIAWRVSDTVVISRRELSNAFLELLTEISRGTQHAH